jgi:hypothetical protein
MATSIEGRWRKATATPCSARYPEELEFDGRGIYTGRGNGDFVVWDAGGWEMLDDGRVRISTANDAEVPYRFTLVGDRLTFHDPEGCEFAYRRVA